MSTSNKSTSSKLTVVAKTEPPAVRTITFRDFDALMNEIDKLAKIAEMFVHADDALSDAVLELEGSTKGSERHTKCRDLAIEQLAAAEKVLVDWPTIEKHLAKCRADFVHYHHPSMLDDDDNIKAASIIATMVADMLGSYPNAAPHDPKRYVPRLIEEIAHSGHFPVIIQGAMRRVVRTNKFPPSIAEMLEAIDKEASVWCQRWQVIDTRADNDEGDTLDYRFKELAKTIAWAKTELSADVATT
jgi:hypothetical protein